MPVMEVIRSSETEKPEHEKVGSQVMYKNGGWKRKDKNWKKNRCPNWTTEGTYNNFGEKFKQEELLIRQVVSQKTEENRLTNQLD